MAIFIVYFNPWTHIICLDLPSLLTILAQGDSPQKQMVQMYQMKYFVFVWPRLVQSGLCEGKISLAPVWLWGGSSSLARKTALTEASVCVFVGLQEERGRRELQKERVREVWRWWWKHITVKNRRAQSRGSWQKR